MSIESVSRSEHVELLPEFLKGLFWQSDLRDVSWSEHRDYIINQILLVGDRRQVDWLRSKISDDELRAFILRKRGRGLGKRDLRFWAAVLEIPKTEIDQILSQPSRQVWDNR